MNNPLRKFFPKSDFSKNIITLMTGTTIAQAIPIVFSPILTRIYTPEEFGVLALFSSLVLGLVTIASLRYDLAILLPKEDSDAKALVWLSRRISLIMLLLTTVLMIFFIEPLSKSLRISEIKGLLYGVSLVVFICAQITIIQMFLNRKKEYNIISKSRMLQGGGTTLSQVGLGLGLGGVTGLVLGFILGQLMSLLYLFKNTKKELEYTSGQDTILMKRYKRMPLLNGPNAIVDSIRTNGINIFITNLFTMGLLGQFSLAWRILQAPLSLINGAFSKVCFQELSVLPKSKHHVFLRKCIKRSFIIGVLPFSLLYFFSPLLFSVFFGENWSGAGQIGVILVPWLFLNLITSPISTYFIIVEKQGLLLIFAVFYMLVPFAAIWYLKSDFLTAMKGLSYSMSFMLVVFIVMVLYVSKKSEEDEKNITAD